MTLSVENAVAGGTNGAATSITVTGLATNGTNRVCVAAIITSGGTYQTISSVTDVAGLTWSRRGSAVQVTDANGVFLNLEVWWAEAPTIITADTLTINFTANPHTQTVIAFAVAGCSNPPSPWVPDVSLPAHATGTVTGTPAVSGITIAEPATLLLEIIGASTESTITLSAGFTDSGKGYQSQQPAVGNQASGEVVGYEILSAPQSSLTLTGGNSLSNGWLMLADALLGGPTPLPPHSFGTVIT